MASEGASRGPPAVRRRTRGVRTVSASSSGFGRSATSTVSASAKCRRTRTVSAIALGSTRAAAMTRAPPSAAVAEAGAPADHSTDEARTLARGMRNGDSLRLRSASSAASAPVMRIATTSWNSARSQGRLPRASKRRLPPGESRSTTASPRTTAVTSDHPPGAHQTRANDPIASVRPTGNMPTSRSTVGWASPAASASAASTPSGAGAPTAAMKRSPTITSQAGAPRKAELETAPTTMTTSLAPHGPPDSAEIRRVPALRCGISRISVNIRRNRLPEASVTVTIVQ